MGGARLKPMGICWDGAEEQFEELLKTVATKHPHFHYVEVGVAYCQTFYAVYQILCESNHPDFKLSGIDLHPLPQAGQEPLFCDPRATLYKGQAGYWLPLLPPIHFALIDGCHAEPCVTNDFLAIEKLFVSGTVVIFHDFQQLAQGGDYQPHCGQMIGVRRATELLGLLNGSRPNWKRLPDLHGDPSRNGADCGVFQHG